VAVLFEGLSKLWAMDHFGDRDIDAFEAWKMFNPKPQAEGLRGMEWDGSRVPQMGYHPHPSTIHG